MKRIAKFFLLPILVFLLTFIQISAEEVITLQIDIDEGDLLMHFVDESGEYISTPLVIDFETSNTSFESVNVQGQIGTPEQKLRVYNATPRDVQISAGLDVENFESDAKWIGEEGSFLAYSEDKFNGGLKMDSSLITLLGDDCEDLGNMTIPMSRRFTFIASEHEDNVESIDILNTVGARECQFDLMGVILTQTIPPRTPAGEYVLSMVLTAVSSGSGVAYTF